MLSENRGRGQRPREKGRKQKRETVLCALVKDSSSKDDTQPLLSSDFDDLETSDLEEKEAFVPDLNFAENDFCIVKFGTENGRGLFEHQMRHIIKVVDGDQYKINFIGETVGINKFVFLEKGNLVWIKKENCL